MNPITIKHLIDENKFIISFDYADGSISFPSIELPISGDIDLNLLLSKLIELIEKKRLLNFEFENSKPLIEFNSKTILIINTLQEIYSNFNSQFDNLEISPTQIETDTDDDLLS